MGYGWDCGFRRAYVVMERRAVFDPVAMGERMKRRREFLGYTQEQLGKRSGLNLSQAAISKIENGITKDAEASTILALAKALHWTSDELMEGVPPDRGIHTLEDVAVAVQELLQREQAEASGHHLANGVMLETPPAPVLVYYASAAVVADVAALVISGGVEDSGMVVSAPLPRASLHGVRSTECPLIMVHVQGACMMPYIRPGDMALVQPTYIVHDRGVEWRPGDRVIAMVDDVAHLKRIQPMGEQWVLAPDDGVGLIPVTDDVRIVAVVVGRMQFGEA